MKLQLALVGVLLGAAAPAWATDIINQDKKAYTVTVVDGGYTAKYKVRGGGSQYGVCGSGPCTFKIPGSTITATKNARLTIRNGKFSQ